MFDATSYALPCGVQTGEIGLSKIIKSATVINNILFKAHADGCNPCRDYLDVISQRRRQREGRLPDNIPRHMVQNPDDDDGCGT